MQGEVDVTVMLWSPLPCTSSDERKKEKKRKEKKRKEKKRKEKKKTYLVVAN